MSRKFGPKQANHPSVGKECPVCHKPFKEGDFTGLVPLGPSDEEAKERAREGRPYNTVATEVHWDCMAEEYKGNWRTISDDSILLIWKCPNGICKDATISPGWLQDNGTPTCECDEDMIYDRTEVKDE